MNRTITDQLRSRGFRLTPQRLAILRILDESDSHMTPLEVYQRALIDIPGITEATVYRTLTFLTDEGLILAAHIGSGQLVYEIAGSDHHHLICRHCGQTQEIGHDLLESLYEEFMAETGYQIDSLHVTFFGLCKACQSSDQTAN